MEEYPFSRTQQLFGTQGMARLKASHVAIFGIGGVGGYATEVLARSGVGALTLIDHDRVSMSNLNRQIIALHSTLGQYKVDAAEDRITDIAPQCRVSKYHCFFSEANAETFDFSNFDFVIDAIDSVKSKVLLISKCMNDSVPVISSMGAGNKLDASAFRLSDLAQTRVCPLARIMRRELKKKGILHLPVVYSEEPPLTSNAFELSQQSDMYQEQAQAMDSASKKITDFPSVCTTTDTTNHDTRRLPTGSVAFVPAAAGILLGGTVIRALADPSFVLPGKQSYK